MSENPFSVEIIKEMNNFESLMPAWSEYWTKEQAEIELIDFKFKGPGWYFTEGQAKDLYSLLVQPTDNPNIYHFYVWYFNPIDVFKWIISAPIQEDNRKETLNETDPSG